jgi:hypothetical protein
MGSFGSHITQALIADETLPAPSLPAAAAALKEPPVSQGPAAAAQEQG